MLHHIEIGLRITTFDGSAHDCGASCLNQASSRIINLTGFFKENLAEHLLFLTVVVVVLYIIVVGLVENG